MASNAKEIEKFGEILKRIAQLDKKYEGMGQDMVDYLDGLIFSHGLNYWDYIHLDSLLGLQTPRTNYHDEMIFIIYHQMTELLFKLVKWEIDLLTRPLGPNEVDSEYWDLDNWYKRISRIVNYFKHLASSFDIMVSGMDMEEFRKFRMALLPASGFQSVQIRHIEIMSTHLWSLLGAGVSQADRRKPIEKLYPNIYWKKGGVDLDTKEKTITLKEFEKKYDESLIRWLEKYKYRNLAYIYGTKLSPEMQKDEKLIKLLRDYDLYANVFWKLSHLSAAARHLKNVESKKQKVKKEGESHHIPATGGTNWKDYLPPKSQRVIFFRTLWTSEEKENWGMQAITKYFGEEVAKKWMKHQPKEAQE